MDSSPCSVDCLNRSNVHYLQDRRSRKSRTMSLEIESMKEASGSADSESRGEPSESHTSKTMD